MQAISSVILVRIPSKWTELPLKFLVVIKISEVCSHCGSDETTLIGTMYPKAYECDKCGQIFIKGKRSLVDD